MRGDNENMVKSVEGVYRNGKVELIEPLDDAEGARVIVTLVRSPGPVDLAERGIRPSQAAHLRQRLAAFAEDCFSPKPHGTCPHLTGPPRSTEICSRSATSIAFLYSGSASRW